MNNRSPYTFQNGLKDGLPIGIGYLSVSIGLGLMCVVQGLSVFAAIFMSVVNMTSAGEVAGLSVIVAGGTLTELMISQLIVNLRYSLMSLSVSQRLDAGMNTWKRMIISFGITDEVFAVSTSKKEAVGFFYMLGLILPCMLGWTLGTSLGAVAGNIMPMMIRNALGLAIYGMFIAILVPPMRKNAAVLAATLFAAAISCCIHYLPCFSSIGAGFSIIISGVVAAAVLAVLVPYQEKEEEGVVEKK